MSPTYENLSSQCNTWVNCTSSMAVIDRSHCQPEDIREDFTRLPVLVNIATIMLIGGGGNMLTLVAIPYCYVKHRKTFAALWNMTTILILHLSLCDLMYCLFGLPLFFELYYKGFFDHSAQMCVIWAALRNLIVYADFITMAAISLNRSIGVCSIRFR